MTASLQRHLWWAAAAPLVALVLVGLLLLQSAFENTVERAFDARLERTWVSLVGGLEATADGRIIVRRPLGQSTFDSVGSGWHWQVALGDAVLLRSRSLWDRELPMLTAPEDGRARHFGLEAGAKPLRAIVRRVELPGRPQPLVVLLTGPRADVDAEVADFVQLSWLAAAGLVLLALAAIGLQLRLGLAPLRRFSAQVGELAAGRRESLDRLAVRELDAVIDELNDVIEQNRRLADGGRKRAGDLAHAIKTPLALLRTLVPAGDGAQREALSRIGEVVDRHLARASADARRSKAHCDAAAEVSRLVELLSRLHPDKRVRIGPMPLNAMVACDASDLQEVLGNLLDNALRAAAHDVRVTLTTHGLEAQVLIEDDGDGLDDEALAQLGERGRRFDESTPGTGLGVAISRDIVETYGGRLDFARSDDGGLRVTLRLPTWRGV